MAFKVCLLLATGGRPTDRQTSSPPLRSSLTNDFGHFSLSVRTDGPPQGEIGEGGETEGGREGEREGRGAVMVRQTDIHSAQNGRAGRAIP